MGDAGLIGEWALTINRGSFNKIGVVAGIGPFEVGRLEMGYYKNEHIAYGDICSSQDDLIRYILTKLVQ
jgi:hypothetical protein